VPRLQSARRIGAQPVCSPHPTPRISCETIVSSYVTVRDREGSGLLERRCDTDSQNMGDEQKCAKARNEGVVDNVESTLDARVQTEDPIFMQITDKLLSPN
jgi:hypothetical protein